jgi:hypothetical protein
MVIPHRSLGAAADPPCAMNRAVVAIIRGMDVAYEFAWVASRGRNHSGACIGHGGGGGRHLDWRRGDRCQNWQATSLGLALR